MPKKYLEKILKARVYDVAIETPLDAMPGLSKRLGNPVLLKREDLQPVFSFKLRGAYNKIVHLSEEQRAKGVIAASAGNHAQGVALAARRLGIQSMIVMPRTTPGIKVESVRALGAKAVGDPFEDGAVVIVEAAYQTWIDLIADAGVVETGAEALEMLSRLLSHVIHDAWCPVYHLLHVGIFRIEHPQGVGLQPEAAILVQTLQIFLQIGHQLAPVSVALVAIAQAVDLQSQIVESEAAPQASRKMVAVKPPNHPPALTTGRSGSSRASRTAQLTSSVSTASTRTAGTSPSPPRNSRAPSSASRPGSR